MRALALIFASLLVAFLGGCASYEAKSYSAKKRIGDYPVFFVVNNLDDNHYIDRLLVSALKAEGKEAESGPETMMPEGTPVLITYRDAWNWDFSEHLVSLHLQVRDAKYGYLLGTASFDGQVTMKTDAREVCHRLVRDLMKAVPRTPRGPMRPEKPSDDKKAR